MRPILFEIGGVAIPSYAVAVLVAFAVAGWIRRAEKRRLGFDEPGHGLVALGALLGAVVGAKLGMVLFVPTDVFIETLGRAAFFDFTGKTVIGGLAGGWIGVELAKKLVGIDYRTGDSFAVAIPVAQMFGRLGCFLEGCCYGRPTTAAWGVAVGGAALHPAALYEAAGLGLLAVGLFAVRSRVTRGGDLFRAYVLGYAALRFVVEFFRGDPVRWLGPLNSVQWLCLAAFVVVAFRLARAHGPSGQGAPA